MVPILTGQQQYATHEVTNQVPPPAPYDASDDQAMLEGLRREGAGWVDFGTLPAAADLAAILDRALPDT